MSTPTRAFELPAQAPAPRRVLLVEDDAVNRILASAVLQQIAGVDHDTAADGEEALELAQQHVYDLILMDLLLPGMHGTETARHIRALPGQQGRVPIVAVSASAFSDEVARSLSAGMNEHLCKPLGTVEMFDVLQRWAPLQAAAAPAPSPVQPAVDPQLDQA